VFVAETAVDWHWIPLMLIFVVIIVTIIIIMKLTVYHQRSDDTRLIEHGVYDTLRNRR